MKKGIFLFASMLMMVSTLGAMESIKPGNHVVDFNRYRFDDQSIEFVERGIKFYIFLDGQFDFNTAPTANVDYIYRNGRRTSRHSTPRGTRIERDYQGRIRRIGNVFISYTYDDKIKRIGSVFVNYQRGRMHKVGNLRIVYNRYGVQLIGHVKGYHDYYYPSYSYGWSSFNSWNSFNDWDTWEYGYYDPFFNNNNFFSNYESFDEDDDYYYYRTKSTKGKKASKGKVIKRKKAIKSRRNESRKKVTTSKKTSSKHK
jgi:hypothetical protein